MKKSNEKGSNWKLTFSDAAYDTTQQEIGAKLVATIDDRGWPHMTLITNLRACAPDKIVWGQFAEGRTKRLVTENPKQGYIWMPAEKPFVFVQAKADFEKWKTEGEELEYFNTTKFLRYNTYVSVWRAAMNDPVAISPVQPISIGGIVSGILRNLYLKLVVPRSKDPHDRRIPPRGEDLFNNSMIPKFICYIDPEDGYPVIIPVFSAWAPDSTKIVFNFAQFKHLLKKIPENSIVAVLVINLESVNHLVKGVYTTKSFGKMRTGVVDVKEVYNSMPPVAGPIYPEKFQRPKVTEFPESL